MGGCRKAYRLTRITDAHLTGERHLSWLQELLDRFDHWNFALVLNFLASGRILDGAGPLHL